MRGILLQFFCYLSAQVLAFELNSLYLTSYAGAKMYEIIRRSLLVRHAILLPENWHKKIPRPWQGRGILVTSRFHPDSLTSHNDKLTECSSHIGTLQPLTGPTGAVYSSNGMFNLQLRGASSTPTWAGISAAPTLCNQSYRLLVLF